MKYLLSVIGLAITILIVSCARQSSPMGGPKDEDPPELLSSNPEQEATNVKPSIIELLFNEYIKVDNPTKQIIITPKVKAEEIEFTPLRNRLQIRLNQELEDSTTYVFNFQKSIQDITEGNPAENLKLVFSTGDEIDSLKFSGNITYLFLQKDEHINDVLIGLYPVTDTTDLFTGPPYYLAQVDSAGKFEITNIKEGEYHAYAWHDANNSLRAEHRNESYGFLTDPVVIEEDITGVHISLYPGNLTELKVNRSSPSGTNFDIILSKTPIEIDIQHPELNKNLYYRVNDRTIRLYHTSPQEDSTAVKISLRDSVGFQLDTTLYAKFEESERSPEKLEVTADGGSDFLATLISELKFNKPVIDILYDSLFIRYDTAGIIPLTPEHIHLKDSSDRTELTIEIPIPDTLPHDTFTVFASDSTFQDAGMQWNENQLEANYSRASLETLSEEITGKIDSEEYPIIVQLLNNSDEIVQEAYLTESNSYSFTQIEPGDYRLRAIIDRNQNGRWDPGNFYEKRQPEPVYYFYDSENDTHQFMIRAGWSFKDINIGSAKESSIDDPIEAEKDVDKE